MLYLPSDYGENAPTVKSQQEREESLYHTVRELLRVRQGQSAFARHDNLEILIAQKNLRSFAYRRDDLVMLCNPSDHAETLDIDTAGSAQIYVVGTGNQGVGGYTLDAQSFVICRK